jgi:glycopeptide antibiotics resistance protein
MGLIERLLHEILFLSGPPEIILNFLLFIPFFFALVVLVPALSYNQALLISVLTSFAAELVQSQITGRVSSVRDCLTNSIGVMIAYFFFIAISNRKKYSNP